MTRILKFITAISICILLMACEKQLNQKKERSSFFIDQDAVSGTAFTELVNSLDFLPEQINGCEARHHKPTDEFLLQCSKKQFYYTNKQVRDALSESTGFYFTEQFGQFTYKWKSENISCSIAIEEENDIFELWCDKGT